MATCQALGSLANLMATLSDKTISELQCTICLEGLKKPRLFNCVHSLCCDCAVQYVRSSLSLPSGQVMDCGWVSCPNCRVNSFVSVAGRQISLPFGQAVPLIDFWLNAVELMEKRSCAPYQKDPIYRRLRQIHERLQLALSRVTRLNEYEIKVRQTMYNRVVELKADGSADTCGNTENNARITEALRSEFSETIGSLWRSRIQVLRECERWRAARCICEFVMDGSGLPSDQDLTALLDQLDIYTAGTLEQILRSQNDDDEPKSSLNQSVDVLIGLMGSGNAEEEKVTQMWHEAFYQGAFAGPAASACLPAEKVLPKNIDPIKASVLWSIEERGSRGGQFCWPVSCAFLRLKAHVVSKIAMESWETVTVAAICDKNNARVQLLDLEFGRYLRSFAENIKPRRVAQSADGIVFVSDEGAACVKIFNPYLELIARFGDSLYKQPAGMAIAGDGSIVMTDAERCFVSVHSAFSTDQAGPSRTCPLANKFPARTITDERVPNPYYVAVDDREGTIIVADSYNNAIKVFDRNGSPLHRFSGFSTPRGVTVDGRGNLLVADSENKQIVAMSPMGKLIQVVLKDIDYPMGLSYRPEDGLLLVTQAGHSSVHAVSLYKLEYNDIAEVDKKSTTLLMVGGIEGEKEA